VDTRLYLDVNRFAQRTSWAHEAMHVYALYLGVVLLAVAALAAYWRARGGWLGDSSSRRIAATLWTPIAAVAAIGIAQPINHAVARVRPYYALSHVEVLVPKAHDFSFPSDHATVAGAVVVGLWLSRQRVIAAIGTILALLLAAARVYVGAHYPGDVLGGLGLGAFVALVGYPLAVPLIERVVEILRETPLRVLVGGHRTVQATHAGPAAAPAQIRATGAVKILDGTDVVARRPAGSGGLSATAGSARGEVPRS